MVNSAVIVKGQTRQLQLSKIWEKINPVVLWKPFLDITWGNSWNASVNIVTKNVSGMEEIAELIMYHLKKSGVLDECKGDM